MKKQLYNKGTAETQQTYVTVTVTTRNYYLFHPTYSIAVKYTSNSF